MPHQKKPFLQIIRPLAGYVYLIICVFDFVIFPVLWNLIQREAGVEIEQWKPLTLEGGAIVHLSYGAILGIYFFGRTKEKIHRSEDV